MTIKAIVFDFDGTIADTYDAFVEIVNHLADEFGYQTLDQVDLDRLKQLSSREIIEESGISPLKIPFLLKRVKKALGQKISEQQPIEDIPSALYALKEQGYKLGIITSNLQENVIEFLNNNQLDGLFDFIYSGTPLFGKNKVINKVLKHYHLTPDELIYVGDETRDIDSARKSKVTMISVGWGFNSPDVLAKHHPDFLISHPQHLLDVLISLDSCEFRLSKLGS